MQQTVKKDTTFASLGNNPYNSRATHYPKAEAKKESISKPDSHLGFDINAYLH